MKKVSLPIFDVATLIFAAEKFLALETIAANVGRPDPDAPEIKAAIRRAVQAFASRIARNAKEKCSF